jgi:hypothetical protein
MRPDFSSIIAGRLCSRAERAAAYVVPVTPAVQSMMAVTYVADIDTSRAFYELLGTTAGCQVNDMHKRPCQKKAEVKLADSEGCTVWACLAHADEILVTVRGAFTASQDDQGTARFLSRRRG